MRAALACLAAVLLGAAPPPDGPAAEAPPTEPTAKAAAVEAHQAGARWFALPVLFWMPETRLGFGATGGLHFHLGDASRVSSLFGAAVYTLERQGSVDFAGDVALPNGTVISARVRAAHFPDVFYGIGPSTRTSAKEPFTRRTFDGYVVGELPFLGGRVRAGPRLDFRAEEIRDVTPGRALASGTVEGSSGFGGVGVGANATYDTRDNPFWPGMGSYGQAYFSVFPGHPGQPAFSHALLEGRHFFPLGGGRTFGVAAFGEWMGGSPPFTMLPSLGSTRFLRGYRGGRFRDKVAWSGQAELRVPVRGRLSATTFAAVGDVAHSLSALSVDTAKVAGGLGLRWRLTGEGANIRVDVAAGKEGVQFYVLVLEAF